MHTFAPKQANHPQRASADISRSRSGASQKLSPRHVLQRRIGNQALRRLLQTNAEDLKTGSSTSNGIRPAAAKISAGSPLMQRKCAACESSGTSCPACAESEKRELKIPARRFVSVALHGGGSEQAVPTNEKERNGKDADASGKKTEKNETQKLPEKKEEATTCPTEKITMNSAKCADNYGAFGTYCYAGAAKWWFKESVKNASGTLCQPGVINQTSQPFQSRSGCVSDEIMNSNGPPKDVAPCTDTTYQTVFMGPTNDKVEQCQYKHTQVIGVTKNADGKSGRVTTSANAGGASTYCDWTA